MVRLRQKLPEDTGRPTRQPARRIGISNEAARYLHGVDLRSTVTHSRKETVTHSRKEYVRGDVHTNSAEGFFSIFKRGMKGRLSALR